MEGKIATEHEAYNIGNSNNPISNKCCTAERAYELGCEIMYREDEINEPNKLVIINALYKPTQTKSIKLELSASNVSFGAFYINNNNKNLYAGAVNTNAGTSSTAYVDDWGMVSGAYDPAGYSQLKGMKINNISCAKYPSFTDIGYSYDGIILKVEFIS